MTYWRTVTVHVGWLVLALAVALVLLAAVLLCLVRTPAPGIDAARVRAACDQYAHLDLTGLTTLCTDAGYQQTGYVQPTGAPPYWPAVHRVVQPEDLDR